MKYRYRFSVNGTASQRVVLVEVLGNNYEQAKSELHSVLPKNEVWRMRLESVVPNE